MNKPLTKSLLLFHSRLCHYSVGGAWWPLWDFKRVRLHAALLPILEEGVLLIFYRPKKHCVGLVFNPHPLNPMASTLITMPPRQLTKSQLEIIGIG
jgi:hypothetical protein